MKKIFITLILLLFVVGVKAQTNLLRGMTVGSPIANMAPIDSIKIVGDNLVFYSGVNLYLSPISTLFYFTKVSTDISPTTSGDDILLPLTSYLIYGDGDTYLYESTDDLFRIVVGGSLSWGMSTTENISYRTLRPFTTGQYLGAVGYYWDRAYATEYYLSTNARITVDGSGNMVLTDAISGSQTLATLLSGVNTYSNGLAKTGSAVKLGGLLTAHTNIGGEGLYDLTIGGSGSEVRDFTVDADDDISLVATTGSVTITSAGASEAVYIHWDAGVKSFRISDTSMVISDVADAKGLSYASDYSTNGIARYGDRWIPDYGAVLDAIVTTPSDSVFAALSGDTIHIEGIDSEVRIFSNGAGVMILEDDSAGVVTLSELVAGGAGVTIGMKDSIDDLYQRVFEDTIAIDSIVPLLADTMLMFNIVLGMGNATDTAIFSLNDVVWGTKWGGSHPLVITKINAVNNASSKDIDLALLKDVNYKDATPTTMLTDDLTVTSNNAGNDATSFSDDDVPIDSFIWLRVDQTTAKPTQCIVSIYGYLKR